jgi:hypothetical protein
MSTFSRLRILFALTLALAATACGMPNPFNPETKADRSDMKQPFDPAKNYPAWAFDQPSYVKPVAELTPEPKVRPDDPLHYFTRDKLVMIRQPSGYTPEEIPRVAVWWTDNNGFHWHRAGFFGRQQSFFPFEVEEDGDYGVRFVGPGQQPAQQTLAYPERVYHVDRVLPDVTVTVEPEQAQYTVGQTLTISWRAADYHLIEYPVRVGMVMDESADQKNVIEIQRGLADDGSITYEIPADALEHQIQFRIDAQDRAGNLGIAFSHVLQVVPQVNDTANDTAEVGAEAESVTDATETKPTVDTTPAPFPSQAAREPVSDAQLIWDGPASAAFASHEGKSDTPPPSATALKDESADEPDDEIVPPQSDDAHDDKTDSGKTSDEAKANDPDLRASAAHDNADLTSGNGLLVPMPATVAERELIAKAVAHPWRSLGRAWDTAMPTIWTLARPQFSLELGRLIEGQFLADNRALWPIAEPAKVDSTVAQGQPGVTAD